MQRAFLSAALALSFGFSGIYTETGYKPYTYTSGYKPYVSETGYKPYVTTTGYKPYGYKPGYKPYISGKGYKPYVKPKYVAPPAPEPRPIKKASCLDNAWVLAALPGPPLTFCMVDVPIEPGSTY